MVRQRLAWLVPVLGLSIATPVLDAARQHVGGRARDLILAVALGFALGWAWYLLHPRSLVDRVGPIAFLVTAMIALSAAVMYLPGVHLSARPVGPGDVIPVGILLGLVMAERWAISPVYDARERRAFRRGTRLSPSRSVRRRLRDSAHVDI